MKIEIVLQSIICFICWINTVSFQCQPHHAISISKFITHKSCWRDSDLNARARFDTYLQAGYIAPERDPEYKNMMKKSLIQTPHTSSTSLLDDDEQNLPFPKEGDIVECPGKWQGERVLGKLRNLQYSVMMSGWTADVLPLKEGKSNRVYSVNKDARLITANITDILPVKAYFVRSENGYNVTMKTATATNTATLASSSSSTTANTAATLILKPALRAPRYRRLDENYTLPINRNRIRMLSVTDLEADMELYNQLKARIIVDSLKLGGVASVVAFAVGGFDIGLGYSAGCVLGAAYLYLLGKRVDTIGYGISTSEASRSIGRLDEILANSRLAMPLLLIVLLSARHAVFDHSTVMGISGELIVSPKILFHLLNKEEFLAAIAGFLTHRLTLYATEIFGQMSQADWLSFLPGSFAEGVRQKENMAKIMSAGAAAGVGAGGAIKQQQKEQVIIVCVTGPVAAGRTAVVDKFRALYDSSTLATAGSSVSGNKQQISSSPVPSFRKSKMQLQPCEFVTTDSTLIAQYPDRYRLISTQEFASLELCNSLSDNDATAKTNSTSTTESTTESQQQQQPTEAVYIGTHKNLFRNDSPVALLKNQFQTTLPSPLLLTAAANGKQKQQLLLQQQQQRQMKRVYLVEGPTSLMDTLLKLTDSSTGESAIDSGALRLINVWISLQTKEQFVNKATQLVQSQLQLMNSTPTAVTDSTTTTTTTEEDKDKDMNKLARRAATKMSQLVNEAAGDVQYYMQRAPMFEYTLLNADSDDETAAEMLDILQSAFQ